MLRNIRALASSAQTLVYSPVVMPLPSSMSPGLAMPNVIAIVLITYLRLFDMFSSHTVRFGSKRVPLAASDTAEIGVASEPFPQPFIGPSLFSMSPSNDPPGPPQPHNSRSESGRRCRSLPAPGSEVGKHYTYIYTRLHDDAIVNWLCRTSEEEYQFQRSLAVGLLSDWMQAVQWPIESEDDYWMMPDTLTRYIPIFDVTLEEIYSGLNRLRCGR